MQIEFFVSKAGDTSGSSLGPWSLDEIAERLARSEIAVTDFIYDEGRQDWIPLMECEALKERLRQSKPKAPPPPRAAAASATVETPVAAETTPVVATTPAMEPVMPIAGDQWFVQKGTHRYGPFSYLGLIRALQEKTVYEFDFAWTEGMESWVRIAELEAFQADKIRDLSAQAVSESAAAFVPRAHPRLKFDSEVIVHDDRSAWLGRSYEGSVGGSGLMIENAALYPGQVIKLHFAPCDGLPAFNAMAEIVNKKYVKDVKGAKSPVTYAVRFLEIDASTASQVKEYFERAAA